MSHWRHTMVDGAEFWIICQRLKLLRKASHWRLIQNLAPSTIGWRQCDIRIVLSQKNVKLLQGVRLRDFDHVGSGKFEAKIHSLRKSKQTLLEFHILELWIFPSNQWRSKLSENGCRWRFWQPQSHWRQDAEIEFDLDSQRRTDITSF